MTGTSGQDKRRYPRRHVFLECRLEGVSGRASIRLQDLSLGGCYIDTNIPHRLGASVTIVTTLGESHVVLRGTVVFADHGHGLGVQFDNLPDDTRRLLTGFLEPVHS